MADWLKHNGPLALALCAAAGLAHQGGLSLLPISVVLAFLLLLLVLRPAPQPVSTLAPRAAPEELPGNALNPAVISALEALDLPVLLINRDEEIVLQNASARQTFGALAEGSHISARLRAPGLLDMLREGLRTNTAQQRDYLERVPSPRAYRVRAAPLPGGQFVITFNDISGLHRMDQMRTDFVANASHELRTPLASLRGFIETLQGPARADLKAQERFLGIMLEQVNRMSRLVDDLLSLSRLEMKAHLAPGQTVDLVPLVSHIRDALQPLADSLGVTLTVSLPETPVMVTGDRDELVQVFENLVENAIKYGQEGKSVEVEVLQREDEGAEVTVTDHGPGIEPEHVPRLTERFYRVNVEASRSKKGTGLGLAIVKHILTRHRARLLIHSEPGSGSRFTVRF